MKEVMSFGARGTRLAPVEDAEYAVLVRQVIATAARRCYCSIFLVDLNPIRDRELKVDDVLLELQAAVWRGVEVKLLIGGSRTNAYMAEAADAARAHALELGIDCRWLTSSKAEGSHAKLLVVDDQVLLGSHNWAPGAFADETQDSVLVASAEVAAYMAQYFAGQWARCGGKPSV